MYDMSGFDYGIEDVVHLLRLNKRRGNYYDCPFCGDTKGRLNINTAKNVYRCNRCDASGGMLKLYAELHNLTLREANMEIREALGKGEYREAVKIRKQEPEKKEPEQSELAPIEVRNHTYSEMLQLLGLNSTHREDLLKRGLTAGQIEERRYRSVPMFGIQKLAEELQKRGCVLEGVPGFYQLENGKWTLNFKARNSGYLIPIESMAGNIQGFQIRLDHVEDGRKYIWLSSGGYQKGTSSGSPVHVVGDRNAESVYLTEGGLKGTISHYLSGNTYICTPGVNQYRNVKPVLEAFRERNLERLVEAYDMDKKIKTVCDQNYHKCGKCTLRPYPYECPYKAEKRKIIQRGCERIYELCRELSIPVSRMVWDMDTDGDWTGAIKGIDDYYFLQTKETV